MQNGDPFPEKIVSMRNISKSFGKVTALSDVSLDIGVGEVVGLLGDNGAGKSTLIKILTGVHPPDEGEVVYQGKPIQFKSPMDARRNGIETVYQDYSLVNLMSIARNFFLGNELTKSIGPLRFLDHKKMDAESMRVISEIGVSVRGAHEFVSYLSGGERQSISIGRAMYFGAKLLVLDEPFAALGIRETAQAMDNIRRANEAGASILVITHNVHHVYPLSHRFALLDHGQKTVEMEKSELSLAELTEVIASGSRNIESMQAETAGK